MNEYMIYSSPHNSDFYLKAACLDKFEDIDFLHKTGNVMIGASYSKYCYPCKKAFLSVSYVYIGEIIYTINGKKYHVKQGEFIICGRGCITNQAVKKGGSVAYTLAISPQFCKRYGLCDDMICHTADNKLAKMFLDFIKAYDASPENSVTDALQVMMHIHYHYKKYSAGISDVGTLSDKQMKKIIQYINRNLFNKIHLEDMARVVGLHPVYFSRVFKKTCGHSPIEYATFLRCQNARTLLLTTDFTSKEIIDACGFYSMTQFKKMYRKLTGRDVEHDIKTPMVVIKVGVNK